MEKTYHLQDDEIAKLEFETRFICNRLTRPGFIKDGLHYEESFVKYEKFARRDMFWVGVYYQDEDLGAVAIEPSFTDPREFTVSQNYNNLDSCCRKKVYPILAEWFRKTPEYLKQLEWSCKIRQLIAQDKAAEFLTERVVQK